MDKVNELLEKYKILKEDKPKDNSKSKIKVEKKDKYDKIVYYFSDNDSD
jgi:hypothetical protein